MAASIEWGGMTGPYNPEGGMSRILVRATKERVRVSERLMQEVREQLRETAARLHRSALLLRQSEEVVQRWRGISSDSPTQEN